MSSEPIIKKKVSGKKEFSAAGRRFSNSGVETGLLDWLKDGKRQPEEGVPVLSLLVMRTELAKEKMSLPSKDVIGVAGKMAQSLRVGFPASSQRLRDVCNSNSGSSDSLPWGLCGPQTWRENSPLSPTQNTLKRGVGNPLLQTIQKKATWKGWTRGENIELAKPMIVCLCSFRRV